MLLLMDDERVRCASLRTLRYSIHYANIFEKFLQSHLDYLVCRSLIVDNGNIRERREAYKLIRRFSQLYPEQIPHSFIYALESIVSSNHQPKSDSMVKCSLELLCELGNRKASLVFKKDEEFVFLSPMITALTNPDALNECHAMNTMLKYVLHVEDEELIESVICALLNAIDRFSINDNSHPILMDSMDSDGPTRIFIDQGMHQRYQLTQTIFSQLLAVFPLWEQGHSTMSGRSGRIPEIYENLRINPSDQMKKFQACSIALRIILQSWIGLTVFCQSKNSSIRLLVSCLLVQTDQIKCNENLPEEQSFLLLPLLMDIGIADDDSIKRSFAREVTLNINEFFEFKQRKHRQYSFQLAQFISHSRYLNDYFTLAQNLSIDSNRRTSKKVYGDPLKTEKMDKSIRDTNTLQSDDYNIWNWNLILSLLKNFTKFSRQIQGDLYERFLDKLFDFFKPEDNGSFKDILLKDPLSDVTCRSLLAFADLLVYPTQSSSNHIKAIASNSVLTLLQAISDALRKSMVARKDGIGQCLINEIDLLSKNCVYYFLFLGRLSGSSLGTQVMHDAEIFYLLLDMLKMDDDFATSTIVALSSFNYYYDGPARNYLTEALKSSCTAIRLYSTRLLRVILRCNPVAFGHWGLNLLSDQLYDQNENIILETISILDEALEDKRLVNLFRKEWQRIVPLENRNIYLKHIYHLALARLCSIPWNQIVYNESHKHLSDIREELLYWDNFFNSQYVIFMETRLFSAYSNDLLSSDDHFQPPYQRNSSQKKLKSKRRKDVHVSSHIYRQLSLHQDGFQLLCSHSRLKQYASELKQHATNCIDKNEIKLIKEALWALGHMGSTNIGFQWFINQDLLAHFLRFAEESQNLSLRGTAFYTLSLIAQTPDGATSLKEFGWETYRVRFHSISTSIANTDSYQSAQRRLSKLETISLTNPNNQSILDTNSSNPTTDAKSSRLKDEEKNFRLDWKLRRSLTMPENILCESNEKIDVRRSYGVILEESIQSSPNPSTGDISFFDYIHDQGLTPTNHSASIPEELLSEIDRNRSISVSSRLSSSMINENDEESLPLDLFRPRLKSAHQSNSLRKLKQLQKTPEVIQSLHAPTSSRTESSSKIDEFSRSRLLRCRFLLKPDAAGYEYIRRLQEFNHNKYLHLLLYTNHFDSQQLFLLPQHRSLPKFHQKISPIYSFDEQHIDKFTTKKERKYSFEEVDFDDADQDENTVYRGIALPVDIRQVIELCDGCNLNHDTWCDLIRSRSRANTNSDFMRPRTATNESTGSSEFSALTKSSFLPLLCSDVSPSSLSIISLNINICMMCRNPTNETSHDILTITEQKYFAQIKSLSSRLMVNIHSDQIEKQLLSWKESHPEMFDNICLYSEICHLFTLSCVRIAAQRFLHDLFFDCQFEKFRQCYHSKDDTLLEEDDQTEVDETIHV
ncbi:unnamed protein product [Rotaria sordida]|uniref:Rapamycin-insensitive companion of mTOR n=1 Tax=Rotaria sordida TaxID=392033 RepID=A0A818KL52_9BILA|nr:unnamed protein product [Rotaria sordida]